MTLATGLLLDSSGWVGRVALFVVHPHTSIQLLHFHLLVLFEIGFLDPLVDAI